MPSHSCLPAPPPGHKDMSTIAVPSLPDLESTIISDLASPPSVRVADAVSAEFPQLEADLGSHHESLSYSSNAPQGPPPVGRAWTKSAGAILLQRQHLIGSGGFDVILIRCFNARFGDLPASVVGVTANFDGATDISKAIIQIRVVRHGTGTSELPLIRRYRPKKMHGGTVMQDREETRLVDAGVSGGHPEAVSGSLQATKSKSEKLSERVQSWIRGRLQRKLGTSNTQSTFRVQLQENPASKGGIIREVPMSFVVQHEGQPYSISVKINIKRRLNLSTATLSKYANKTRTIKLDGVTDLLQNGDETSMWLGEVHDRRFDMRLWPKEAWRNLAQYEVEEMTDDGVAFGDGRF